MARKSRTGVLKRQREMKKAEKAALKREKRDQRAERPASGAQVATSEDLEGYGVGPAEDEPRPAGPRGRPR